MELRVKDLTIEQLDKLQDALLETWRRWFRAIAWPPVGVAYGFIHAKEIGDDNITGNWIELRVLCTYLRFRWHDKLQTPLLGFVAPVQLFDDRGYEEAYRSYAHSILFILNIRLTVGLLTVPLDRAVAKFAAENLIA